MMNTDTDNILYARHTMDREPIKVIADIICHKLNLPTNRVFLFNSINELPKDDGLYVVLQQTEFPPFGVKTEYKEIRGTYTEVQSYMTKCMITVSLVSKNTEARTRRYEANLALNSTYSQQMQEKYGFHIAKCSPVANRSFLEASSRLYRFDTEVTVITAYTKADTVDYYNQFDNAITYEA